jgi:hypothetical protein
MQPDLIQYTQPTSQGMAHNLAIHQSPQKNAFSGSANVGLGGLLSYAVDGEESAADHMGSVWGGNQSIF